MVKKISLITALLLTALMLMASCGNGAPDISEVKDDFIALIDASREVNDIFFGEGLPTYPRTGTDGVMKYDEASGVYYIYYEDTDSGKILKYYDKDEKVNKYLSVRGFADGETPTRAMFTKRGTNIITPPNTPSPRASGYTIRPLRYITTMCATTANTER